MDYEYLIENVREYEELYDSSNGKYSDNQHKDIVWKHIAENLNQPASACKKSWVNLRDSFRRAIKRKKEMKSGQPMNKKQRKWKFEDEMSFLLAHFQEKDTINNMENDDSVLNHEVEERDDGDKSSETFEEPGMVCPKTNILSFPKRRKDEIGSSILMKYLMEHKAEEQTVVQQLNLVDSFLSGIGATLKTFSPYNQNIAKSKIFSIVSEIEMQQILQSDITVSSAHSFLKVEHSVSPHPVQSFVENNHEI